MNCDDAKKYMENVVFGEANDEICAQIREHFIDCSSCYREYKELKEANSLLMNLSGYKGKEKSYLCTHKVEDGEHLQVNTMERLWFTPIAEHPLSDTMLPVPVCPDIAIVGSEKTFSLQECIGTPINTEETSHISPRCPTKLKFVFRYGKNFQRSGLAFLGAVAIVLCLFFTPLWALNRLSKYPKVIPNLTLLVEQKEDPDSLPTEGFQIPAHTRERNIHAISNAAQESEYIALAARPIGDWYSDTLKMSNSQILDVCLIKKGDTFFKIANEVGFAVEDLQRWNPNIDNSRLIVGQPLFLGEIPHSTFTQPGQTLALYHFTRSAEFPAEVARRYNIPLNVLLLLNRLHENTPLAIGQRLRLVPATFESGALKFMQIPKSITEETSGQYMFAEGELASTVAKRMGISTNEFLEWNNLATDRMVRAGAVYWVTPPENRMES